MKSIKLFFPAALLLAALVVRAAPPPSPQCVAPAKPGGGL